MKISELYKIFSENQSIAIDSRRVKPGSIFFAIKGENFDGNKFASAAIKSGAKLAVISDRKYKISVKTVIVKDTIETLQELAKYHRENLKKTHIIGITGSNGKTTTKELIYKILSEKYNTYATPKNFNNHIGLPLSILSIKNKTDFAIIEMGANHQGEIKQLCNIAQPDSGLITNIGKAHLEGFGSLENLIETKIALFEAVKQNKGVFFLNTNDENLTRNIKRYEKIIKYGKVSDNEIVVKRIKNNPFLNIGLSINNKDYKIETKLIGEYNIENIIASLNVGLYFNVDLESIKSAILNYQPKNNRSQLLKTEKNILVLDMYNANPTSMRVSIENFAKLDLKNKILLIGDMLELGKNEKLEHQQIIDYAKTKNFEQIITVGEIFYGCNNLENILSFKNVEELNKYLKKKIIKNKSILLKASNGTGLKKSLKYL